MKKLTVLLLFMALLVACSNKPQLSVAHYKSDGLEIDIQSDKKMGVVFKFEKLGFGGQAHYTHVSDNIFSLEVDDKGRTFYLVEDQGVLNVIDSQYTIEEINKGEYTPEYLLNEVKK